MEVNIAELITIITFLVGCTGYIKRRIRKLEEKQQEKFTENNQQLQELQENMGLALESVRRITEVIGTMIKTGETQNSLNESIIGRINDIVERLDRNENIR